MALTANDAQDVFVGNCYVLASSTAGMINLGVTQEGSVFHFAGKYYEKKVHEFGETIMSRKVLGMEAWIDATFKSYTTSVLSVLRGAFFSGGIAVATKVGNTANKLEVLLYPQAAESTLLLKFYAAEFEPQWDFDMKNDADGVLKTRIHARPHTSDSAVLYMSA